jgi:periplasmic protein TonB
MDNKSWMKSSIDDLVFEHRNQSYGAFSLRRLYDKNMSKGMMIGTLIFLLLIFTPMLYAMYQDYLASRIDELSMKEVTLVDPPSLDPKKPPPPPPPKIDPPPIKDQIKFVPPKVEKDEKVIDEEPPPTVEEMKDKVIADVTKEGDENGVDASLVEPEAPPPPPKVIEEPAEDENKVFQVVQQKPEFPDGERALLAFLGKNLKYPAIARENGIEGNVVVRFVVSKTGEVRNAEVLRGIGGGCDAEALRVVNSMPKWNPGKNNGKAVNVTYTLPVRFKLEG